MASTYLERTQSGTETDSKKATISVWVKIGSSHVGNFNAGLFGTHVSGNYGADGNTQIGFYNGGLYAWFKDGGSTYYKQESTRRFEDHNGWYHLVYRFDTTQAAGGDRIRIYCNGEEVTSFDTSSGPPQNTNIEMNNGGRIVRVGTMNFTGGSHNYFDGIMSHFHFCDGYSYGPTEFGETDNTTGAWKIKTTPNVTYGTNGFFILKDGNSVTDQSSNTNNLVVSGGTLTKTEDNPSNIFATWNPSWSQSNGNIGDITFSHGNLTTISAVSYRTTPTTLGMSSTGKFYWEIKRNETGSDTHFGVMSENATPANTATWIGNAANGWVIAGDNGQVYTGGTGGSTLSGGAVGNGEIFMGAYDGTTGKLYFGKNGAWAGSANPETGANPAYTLDNSLIYFPVVSTGGDVSANFGNGYFGTTAVSSAGTNASNIGIFEYNVPTGYTALSTKGINSF